MVWLAASIATRGKVGGETAYKDKRNLFLRRTKRWEGNCKKIVMQTATCWKRVFGRFQFRKKNRKFRWEQVEFPIGKKLFHLVVNPGMLQWQTVDLELVQTTRNVNGTRHSIGKFQPGKWAHLFRFSTFSGNFPVGWTDETCSIYRRTRNSGNFD